MARLSWECVTSNPYSEEALGFDGGGNHGGNHGLPRSVAGLDASENIVDEDREQLLVVAPDRLQASALEQVVAKMLPPGLHGQRLDGHHATRRGLQLRVCIHLDRSLEEPARGLE